VHEMAEANNEAQSNYDAFISATSSPGTREITAVTVANPYDRPTRYFIRAGQDNPLYRVYLEHSSVRLEPGEQRAITVMFEYAPEAPQPDPLVRELAKRYLKRPSFVGLLGMIEDPHEPAHGLKLLQGVTAKVMTGRDTRFSDFKAARRSATGRVVTSDDGRGVRSGKVVLVTQRGRHKEYQAVTLRGGSFKTTLRAESWTSIQAYYTGDNDYSDCESKRLRPPRK
jgi:hypothetical protein